MSAIVTLTIIRGPLDGAKFVYRDPTLCPVGRSEDCALQLPNDVRHLTVSRHHCLLEINPPEVRVSDLGSRNGTFVNGELISRFDPLTHQNGRRPNLGADYPLADGDELRVGDTVFRVSIGIEEGAREQMHFPARVRSE